MNLKKISTPKAINQDIPTTFEDADDSKNFSSKEKSTNSSKEEQPTPNLNYEDIIAEMQVHEYEKKRSKKQHKPNAEKEKEKAYDIVLKQKESVRWIQLWALLANDKTDSAVKNAEAIVEKKR